MRLIGLNPPETVVQATLWRNNRLETVKIKLGKWPVNDDAGIIETKPRFPPWRGLLVDFPTARHRAIDQRNFGSRRVLVTKVIDNTPGHAARLEPGNFITHVNKIAVQSPAEFHAAVKGAS